MTALPQLGLSSVSSRMRLSALTVVFAVGLVFIRAGAFGAEAPPAGPVLPLNVIYSASLLRTLNKNDAIAAMRVWVDTVGRQKGFQLQCDVSVADGISELTKRVVEGRPGLVLVDPEEYVALAGLGLLEPTFVGVNKNGDSPGQFLLITNQASGVSGLPELRGRTINVESASRADLGRKWIEVLLSENGLPQAHKFFNSLNSMSSASAALLPVFFGKVDAAIADPLSFEVMKELNPQLGVRLRVVASSPPFPRGILCLDKRHIPYRSDLMQALRELHQDAAGRQILLVFRSNRLVAVDPQALERVRQLLTKYRSVSERTTPRPSGPGVSRSSRGGETHQDERP